VSYVVHCHSRRHCSLDDGAGRALDPSRRFIVVPNHFGAGVSSSPSNTPAPFDRGRSPHVTTHDNVVAQHRLLTEELNIERIRLVSSWSMGACQAYARAALHPEMVEALALISASARTAHFNKVFLAGNIRAITTDSNWDDGFYLDRPPVRGVRAMAALYAGWGFSEPSLRCGPGGTTISATIPPSTALRHRAPGHPAADDRHPVVDRPVLPSGGQRIRGEPDPGCRAAG